MLTLVGRQTRLDLIVLIVGCAGFRTCFLLFCFISEGVFVCGIDMDGVGAPWLFWVILAIISLVGMKWFMDFGITHTPIRGPDSYIRERTM